MPRVLLFPPVPIVCPSCGATFQAPPPPAVDVEAPPPTGVSPIALALARVVVASIRRLYADVAPPALPQPGDLTICHVCSDILRFTDDPAAPVVGLSALEWFALTELEREELRRLQYRVRLAAPR
jgi:hypothetical protein